MIALCKCGIDISKHEEITDHAFDASGTKYPCFELINGYLCPRPKYHHDEGVCCGPLTGMKLWD